MTRRESYVGQPVAYAAVGASNAPDLLRFPPDGAMSFGEELRIGSGADRFLSASSLLMTWGLQRNHGIDITEVTAGDGGQYSGVLFDEAGVPQPSLPEDVQFSPDGVPYLRAGAVVKMSWASGRSPLHFRVVYTVDESRQVGFGIGSADEESVPGEVRYLVEHREDDSVWATAVGFVYAPATGILGRKGKQEARAIISEVRTQLSALAPGASHLSAEETDAGDSETESGVDPEAIIIAEQPEASTQNSAEDPQISDVDAEAPEGTDEPRGFGAKK